MKIGLVLASIPGYSETFFRNKIHLLRTVPGVDVILFVDNMKRETSSPECPVIYAPQISENLLLGTVQFFLRLIYLVVSRPVRSSRLFSLNQRSGFGIKRNLQSLVQSSHLLSKRVTWLHFGFGTMSLIRENVAKAIGAKMAVSFRGFDIAIYPLKHEGCYDRVWKTVDKVHVISNDLAELVIANGYPAAKPMQKITPAIDTAKFIKAGRKKELSYPFKFITVARLHWKKGLEYTLDSLKILQEKGVDFHYTIVGEGDEYERLIFGIHQLGLQERITLAGKLSSDEVIRHMEDSDLYIQYSIQEGFCNAVLEAQAMGLLCVVSDAEGLSENVLDGITGWVVPSMNAKALADRIEYVLGLSPDAMEEIREAAIARVKAEFNLQKHKMEFLEFYGLSRS